MLDSIRHLLSHTSGVNGDLFLDTGRGDGCVEKYVEATGALAGMQPPMEFVLVPVNDTTFVGRPEGEPQWLSVVFYELADGSPYIHLGVRAVPKLA